MIEFIIEKPHDLEVNKNRTPLSFHFSTPEFFDENTIPIVVLHGFSEYSGSEYMNSLHKSLTKKYNVAIITVNYIGTFTKIRFINNDAPYDFINFSSTITEGENKVTFLRILYALLNDNSGTVDYLNKINAIEHSDFTPYKRTLHELIVKIENNLCDGIYVIDRLYEMGFKTPITKITTNTQNDHQDFGVIQTIDILTAISHIKSIEEYQNINWSRLSIVGSSHGGYLASMCDKFAPNTFNMIVNNSGWLYCNSGEILNTKFKTFYLDMMYLSSEDSYWSDDPENINFFDKRHGEIRSLLNSEHIKEQKIQTINIDNKQYIFSHTIDDHLIPIDKKDTYIDTIEDNYNHINYIRVDNHDKLDGKTFKSLEHGADASLKGLVIDFIINNNFDKSIDENDFDLQSIIKYSCTDGSYIINFTEKYPTISFI